MQTLEPKTKDALHWIVDILNKYDIPFQISGGFAAKIYGSPRSLNDIDIDIPESEFEKIYEDVKEYITLSPQQYKDKKWDLYLMTLNYEGQEIDIGGAFAKIYDSKNNKWIDSNADFEKAVWVEVEGLKVPVVPKKDLMNYKKLLDGEHQKIDIEAVRNS